MDGTVTEGQLLAERYQVGSLLGEGGMAGVYEGYDTRLARPVAIKVLRATVAAHDSMRRRFEREARSAAGLSDAHVVAVYDSGEDNGVAYLVMERLPGITLADRISEGPVPASEVVTIAEDVLAALDAAHVIGLVHRDIKPGNILLTENGHAKVADFGIAKSVPGPDFDDTAEADLTRAGMVIGTPAYLSPERIAGGPATSYSDLYALGVVMYEALAGHKPVAGNSPAAVAEARRMTPLIPLARAAPDTPAWLNAVVDKALAPRVEDRYASARAMFEDLQAEGTGAVTGVPPATATVAATHRASTTRLIGDGWDGGTGWDAGADRDGGAGWDAGAGFNDDDARVPTAEQAVVVDGASPPAPRREVWNTLRAPAAAFLVAAVIVALALLLGGGHKHRQAATPPTTRSPTTTAPPTPSTTLDPVATALVQEAQRLQAVGGSGRTSLAEQLLGVANQPAGAQRAQVAEPTIYDDRIFAQQGEITPAEYTLVSFLLQQAGAPAIAPPNYAPPTTLPTVTSPATTSPAATTPVIPAPATTSPVTTIPVTRPATPLPITPVTPASTVPPTAPRPAGVPIPAPAPGHGAATGLVRGNGAGHGQGGGGGQG